MLQNQAFTLYFLAAWGVVAIIAAFLLAMRKLKNTERKLEESEERLNGAYTQLSHFHEKVKMQRKQAYRNGFVVGFRSGVGVVRGDKFVFDEDYHSDDDSS